MKHLWQRCALGCLVLALVTVFCRAAERDRTEAQQLFDDEIFPSIRLQLSSAAMEQLRQSPRKYVLGTVREGNRVYTNVSIRLKGGPGSFRPLDDKPAFTINFSRQAQGQQFHGLKKLHLNNSVQDNTFLAEKISRELFNAAGAPAPRAGHAVVHLNGNELGFYVLIEGINKAFLKQHFKDASGNLYDGHSQSEVTRKMRLNSGATPTDHSRLQALARAAQEPDLALRLEKLEAALDIDRFLSFLATEIMLCHWDGYALNRNNFRVFHDRDQDRMVFLPQGVDQIFQRQNIGILPQMAGLVARSAMEVPELRERYRARMAQLLTNTWKINDWTNRIYETGAKMHPVLAKADPEAAAGYAGKVASFSRRFQQRVRALERQLLMPAAESSFDSDGLLKITGWQPQIDIGQPVLEREGEGTPTGVSALQQKGVESPTGVSALQRKALHIKASADAAGSWRARVELDKGRYRFHGRVRLQDVELNPGDPKTGVGLRVSRHKFSRALSGATQWTTVAFDFPVTQDNTIVELVCELRAKRGEVWFDESSLRLIRLPE